VSAPAVSVLIRAYSGGAGLSRAIASVLDQTFEDYEVVVSDDSGSHGPLVERFADPRLRYEPNPAPAGPAANLRRAIGLSSGRLLAVLNEDDEWRPSFLEHAVRVFADDPALGVFFADAPWEVGGQLIPHHLPFAPGRHARFLAEVLERGVPCAACVSAREVWDAGERTLPLRDEMVGDLTLWLRAAEAGWAFHYRPEALGIYHVHAGQLTWADGFARRAIATLEAFRFDDPHCEGLRRARLAELYMASARVQLKRRRLRLARADVGRARRAEPARLGARDLLALSGLRELTVRLACSHPRALASASAIWRRVRPPVYASTPGG
jgi:hypothetical protein